MATHYKPPTAAELTFAYRFLHYLTKSATSNLYLLLAVVAWMRKESGGRPIGNNFLNLRPGPDDAKFRSGIRLGRVGHFSVYKSLDAAAHAAANRLLGASKTDYRGYYAIVRDAQRVPKTEADKVTQALDFIGHIALSKWSSDHYGLGKKPTVATYNIAHNSLFPILQAFSQYYSGHKFVLPKAAYTDPVKPKAKVAKPKPAPHETRFQPPAPPSFIDPYGSFKFYEARRTPMVTMAGDPLPTG